ncbi:MAG: VOC family protein, partial [Bdellovibrionales bacterium]
MKAYVLAVYRLRDPKRVPELRALLARHRQLLLEEGLIKLGVPLWLQASETEFIEGVEWTSEQAAQNAHENPKVRQIWEEFAEIVEFSKLGDLEQAAVPFSKFTRLDVDVQTPAQFADTMMSARDYQKLALFYQTVSGLRVDAHSDDYTMLKDPQTGQALCITNGPSVDSTGVGLSVRSRDEALQSVRAAGGIVSREWEFAHMKGANCQ